MKHHFMDIGRIAIAVILIAGMTCTVTGCHIYMETWHIYIPWF